MKDTAGMVAFEIACADAIEPARLHAAFTEAFADYLVGPFELPFAQWPQFLARQGVELALSRVAVESSNPVAFCLVAPRPEAGSWRLGTMGALPATRGSGVAPALLDDFVARAKGAGTASVELECFAQNTRALRLYEGRGFHIVEALHGYERAVTQAVQAASVPPAAVALEDAFDWLDACRDAGCALPFQVTPRVLRVVQSPLQAWREGDAQLVFSAHPPGRIHIHSLVDRRAAQQDADRLVAALLARHPDAPVHVPQLQRPSAGGEALERHGFTRLPLHQVWMRRSW